MITKQFLLEHNDFIDNEFLLKYVELINNNQETKRELYKTASHHIIPKCWFMLHDLPIDNMVDNLVNLRHYDHLLAHYYLSKCSVGNFHEANNHALRMIKGQTNQTIDSIYEDDFNRLMMEANKDTAKKVSLYRNNMSQKDKDRYSKMYHDKLVGRICITNGKNNKYIHESELAKYQELGWYKGSKPWEKGRKEKISNALKGYDYGPEFREKCRKGKQNKKVMNNGFVTKYIPKDRVDEFIEKSWKFGRIKK